VRLYRVLYYDENAAPNEKGGVLYIPPQGEYRIDNPRHYKVLYLGDTRGGVCAEVFYRGAYRLHWSAKMLRPLQSGHRRILAWYDIPNDTPICTLDDLNELLRHNLRPSLVITRDYRNVTQPWALAIFQQKQFSGVSWCSYCDSRWTTVGLWDTSIIRRHGIEELNINHAAIVEAARIVGVRIRVS
jgi:hypothetical protein